MPEVAGLATLRSRSGEISVMLYGSNDTVQINGSVNATVTIREIEIDRLQPDATACNPAETLTAVATYTTSDRLSDPRSVWIAAGSPSFPSPPLLRQMRQGQEVAPDSVHLVNLTTGASHDSAPWRPR